MMKSLLLVKCHMEYPTTLKHVYIDLGARDYESSVGWFRTMYPRGELFEVHAFEIHKVYEAGYAKDKNCTFHLAASWTENGCIALGTDSGFASANHKLIFVASESHKVPTLEECNNAIKKEGDNMIGPVPAYDIALYLQKQLAGLTPENSFVVLKMDIEGPEFVLVNHLIKHGLFQGLIKETMVECHWSHHGKSWSTVKECACSNLQEKLRNQTVYAHQWY